jgi:uncharacterized membrane protein YhaH (DUF805 family)
MTEPGRETSVGWALFLWDGRIGRRIFILGSAFWMMVNAGLVALATARASEEAMAMELLSMFLASIALSMVSLVMLGIKRLHDIGLPGIAATLLVIPAFSLIAFFLLCVWPSAAQANRYGPAANERAV